MIARFLGALQFLTILPVRSSTASPGAAAIFFPVTGVLLGSVSGLLFLILAPALGPGLSALAAVAALAFLTGCLHEDGLADVADAVRAGRTRDRMLAILKDSRIGTYGAVALMLSLSARWLGLMRTTVSPVLAMALAAALARAAMVMLAAISPAAGTGLGRHFIEQLSPATVAAVFVQFAILLATASLFVGWRYGAALFAAGTGLVLLARVYFTLRLGGITGDCLGATCHLVETVNLVILAWHPSF